MHFYGIGYRETLDLPLRTFWLMSTNVNRIAAENDIRRLSVAGGAGSSDAFKGANEALRAEMGVVVKRREEEVARDGLNTLKSLASKQPAIKK